jgi:hypothetical protein
MKTRIRTIKLSRGDVRELRIHRNKRATRLVVYRRRPGSAAHPSPARRARMRGAEEGIGHKKMNHVHTAGRTLEKFLPAFCTRTCSLMS